MDGQTQIPEALMGAMLIEQGAQKGQFQPMTRDGQPTVAAQLMQRAAPQPAGVEQAMGQAGLAGQIRAMQMQQAQQAMMQQAMAQQQPQMLAGGGLTSLNVDIDGFADGGIVGYAGDNESVTEDPWYKRYLRKQPSEEGRLEKRGYERVLDALASIAPSGSKLAQVLGDRRPGAVAPADRVNPELAREILGATTPMQEIPEVKVQEQAPPPPRETRAAAPQASGIAATSPAAAFYDQAREKLGELKSGPVSQQAGVTAGLEALAADDEMRRKLGLPTLAEQFAKMSEEDKALTAERQALIAGRLREAQEKRSSGQLGAFLRSARGRSLGDTLGAAERGREAFESNLTGQIRGFEDLQLEIKGLQIQRQNALNKARDDIAMGKKKEALDSLQNAQNKANEIAIKEADLYRIQAGTTSEEFRTRMTTEEQARGRAEMAKQRERQDQDRVMLAAQGRLTDAEKVRAQVAEKYRAQMSIPKDAKDAYSQQMRANAENEIRQAEQNVATARALYNRLLNQTLSGATESQMAAFEKYSGKK